MLCVDFEANPFTRLGQVTHLTFGRSIECTKWDGVGVTPVHTMFPGTIIELQHHRLGWIGRIDKDIGEQDVSVANLESRVGTCEEVLRQRSGCSC